MSENQVITLDPGNEVEGFSKALSVLQDGGQILSVIRGRADKAETVGKQIMQLIQENETLQATTRAAMEGDSVVPKAELAWRLTDLETQREALDQKANTFLANCGKAFKEIELQRTPITQMLTVLSAPFIEPGKKLDVSTKGSVPAMVQASRNMYAKWVLEKAKKEKELAERRAKKREEEALLRVKIQSLISAKLDDFISRKKIVIQEHFNAITLENFEEKGEAVKQLITDFPHTRKDGSRTLALIKVDPPFAVYHTPEELEAINQEVFDGYPFNDFYQRYKDEILNLKIDLIDKLPAKKAALDEAEALRLEEIRLAEEKRRLEAERAKASAEEKLRLDLLIEENRKADAQKKAEADRLEKEAKDREVADLQKIEEETKRKAQELQEQTRIQESGARLQSSFDLGGSLAGINAAAPKTKQPLKIRILTPAAWPVLVDFYFTRNAAEFMNATEEDLEAFGKRSFSIVKTYAERLANDKKKPERIQSSYLEYYEDVKALTVKA